LPRRNCGICPYRNSSISPSGWAVSKLPENRQVGIRGGEKVVYEHADGEFIFLSKPFKAKERAERERAELSAHPEHTRASVDVGFVRTIRKYQYPACIRRNGPPRIGPGTSGINLLLQLMQPTESCVRTSSVSPTCKSIFVLHLGHLICIVRKSSEASELSRIVSATIHLSEQKVVGL
jgi:hypothetical protein